MLKIFDIKKRILITVITYTCLLSIAIGINNFILNKHLKGMIWDQLISFEVEHFKQPFLNKNASSNALWFDNKNSANIPQEFDHLAIGTYEKIHYNHRIYMVRVIDTAPYKQIIAIDITQITHHENQMMIFAILLTFLAVICITVIIYRQLHRFIHPLVDIAQKLSTLSPLDKLDIKNHPANQLSESAVLLNEIDKFIDKSQELIKKEKEFFEIASHELRTPISAIAGAIEITLKHPKTSQNIMPHLQRIHRITSEMEELTTMLLFLSRNKEKLEGYAEDIDLYIELPRIIEDHMHLCFNKELTITHEITHSTKIKAPPQLLKITVSNLLRNAIEHSDRGNINIYYKNHTFIIDDPGHGMTAQEISALYTQMARNGTTSKSGIGIDLTLKICQHYGWKLSFSSLKGQGTIAQLQFNNT